MKLSILMLIFPSLLLAQDLTEGLRVNDLELHPMQTLDKPAYLQSVVDPSFGTTIRRITDAGDDGVIVPMYSTVQAWNADESLMILYNQSDSRHDLLDGKSYEFMRQLDDVRPADLEQIFWDFIEPDIFYYLERGTYAFIKYAVSTQEKETLIILDDLVFCSNFSMGNDIQMISWDSDVFCFRCENDRAYSYRISTGELIQFDLPDVGYAAPAAAPSGDRYLHRKTVYDREGRPLFDLNKGNEEHSCIGKLPNGNDGFYAIAFAQGPQGGCIGDIIAHDLTFGTCTPVISQSQGYDYPQSGTHISALAHKNTEGGWIAASMIGYDRDGQELLDQELVIARAGVGDIQVCRIGHHRSDEEEFDYWGEPHAVISPTGTRVLFGSDWSGIEDGKSVDSYVVELPAYDGSTSIKESVYEDQSFYVYPNPTEGETAISFKDANGRIKDIQIFSAEGKMVFSDQTDSKEYTLLTAEFPSGVYFVFVNSPSITHGVRKLIKH